MENLLTFTSRPAAILFFRILGLCLVLAGFITAILGVSIGSMTPTLWILLGLSSFLGAICNTLFAIRRILEAREQNKR